MTVDRLLPTDEAADLIALTCDIADKVLDPIVDSHEKAETYPEGVFAQLGAAGLLSLPQPEEWGGGGVPYVGGDRRRGQRAQPVVASAVGVRYRGAEAPLAAGHAVG
jgi:alkylation response protein AidB-like acyl-CoA dehydrogenase